MSNDNLSFEALREQLATELGLEVSPNLGMNELLQRYAASGQDRNRGQLLTKHVDKSGLAQSLVHNTPQYGHCGFILIPPTDRPIRLEAQGYISKTSGNTVRGAARCQIYHVTTVSIVDGDIMYIPLEAIANDGIGFLRASHIIEPFSGSSRIYGASWDTFQYVGSLTCSLFNGGIGGDYTGTQLRTYLL